MPNIKIVHVAPQRHRYCDFETLPSCLEMNAEALLRSMFNDFKEADIIVIDENYDLQGEQEGVKLLKLLRLSHVCTHCLVYSPLPLKVLLEIDPRNIILLSKGVSFFQIPHQTIDGLIVEELVDKTAPEDLSYYFNQEMNELSVNDRHSKVNWWGVFKLATAMNKLQGGNQLDEQQKTALRKCLDEMDSFDGKLMQYIRKTNGLEHLEVELDNQGNTQNKQYKEVIANSNPKVLYVDDMADYGWSYLFQQIIYDKVSEDRFVTFPMENYLKLPDDELFDKIMDQIRSVDPDLIILDLRLRNENKKVPIEELSGIYLLERIRKEAVECPVLVVTASNKQRTLGVAMDKGADALWIKEGFDEMVSNDPHEQLNYSIEKYYELVYKLYMLCKKEGEGFYSLYKGYYPKMKTFDPSIEGREYWWEKYQWWKDDKKRRHPVPRSLVYGFFKENFNLYWSYLKLVTENPHTPLRSVFSNMVMNFSAILERIHSKDETLFRCFQIDWEDYYDKERLFCYLFKLLLIRRNTTAHQTSFKTFHHLNSFFKFFYEYLNMDPDNLSWIIKKRADGEGFYVRSGQLAYNIAMENEDVQCLETFAQYENYVYCDIFNEQEMEVEMELFDLSPNAWKGVVRGMRYPDGRYRLEIVDLPNTVFTLNIGYGTKIVQDQDIYFEPDWDESSHSIFNVSTVFRSGFWKANVKKVLREQIVTANTNYTQLDVLLRYIVSPENVSFKVVNHTSRKDIIKPWEQGAQVKLIPHIKLYRKARNIRPVYSDSMVSLGFSREGAKPVGVEVIHSTVQGRLKKCVIKRVSSLKRDYFWRAEVVEFSADKGSARLKNLANDEVYFQFPDGEESPFGSLEEAKAMIGATVSFIPQWRYIVCNLMNLEVDPEFVDEKKWTAELVGVTDKGFLKLGNIKHPENLWFRIRGGVPEEIAEGSIIYFVIDDII